MGIHAQKSGDGTPVDQLFEYVHQGYRVLGFWPIPLLYDILSSLEMATLLFSIFELSNIDWHFLRCVVQRPTQLILWDGWLCRTHAFQSFVCCFSRIQFPSPYNIILPHFGGGLPHVRPGRENAWQACRGATVKNPPFNSVFDPENSPFVVESNLPTPIWQGL